jgi:hypothetical protein
MGLGEPVESFGSEMAKDFATSSVVASRTVSESAEGAGSGGGATSSLFSGCTVSSADAAGISSVMV